MESRKPPLDAGQLISEAERARQQGYTGVALGRFDSAVLYAVNDEQKARALAGRILCLRDFYEQTRHPSHLDAMLIDIIEARSLGKISLSLQAVISLREGDWHLLQGQPGEAEHCYRAAAILVTRNEPLEEQYFGCMGEAQAYQPKKWQQGLRQLRESIRFFGNYEACQDEVETRDLYPLRRLECHNIVSGLRLRLAKALWANGKYDQAFGIWLLGYYQAWSLKYHENHNVRLKQYHRTLRSWLASYRR